MSVTRISTDWELTPQEKQKRFSTVPWVQDGRWWQVQTLHLLWELFQLSSRNLGSLTWETRQAWTTDFHGLDSAYTQANLDDDESFVTLFKQIALQRFWAIKNHWDRVDLSSVIKSLSEFNGSHSEAAELCTSFFQWCSLRTQLCSRDRWCSTGGQWRGRGALRIQRNIQKHAFPLLNT